MVALEEAGIDFHVIVFVILQVSLTENAPTPRAKALRAVCSAILGISHCSQLYHYA